MENGGRYSIQILLATAIVAVIIGGLAGYTIAPKKTITKREQS